MAAAASFTEGRLFHFQIVMSGNYDHEKATLWFNPPDSQNEFLMKF
jgi:hypothetical protein